LRLVKVTEFIMYSRILVPVDGSETSNRGLAEAIQMAKLTGGRIKLLHVLDTQSLTAHPMADFSLTPDWWGLLKEAGESILNKGRSVVQAAGVPVETELRDGLALRVSDGVVAEAKRWAADLVVLGTHGRRGVGRLLLGSDAEQIMRSSPVPVLLVHGGDAPVAAR
jgi:nucleotide-binding universal stress UspA family protein